MTDGQRTDWHDRWDEGRIGFHRAAVNDHLVDHLEHLPKGRVLVPLCGKSVDLWYLAERGFDVTGVELVPRAVQALFADAGIAPKVQGTRASGGGIAVEVGDFFALPSPADGRFDAIWDRAALIAIEPQHRERYRDRVLALLAPRGVYLLVAIEIHDVLEGPPFSLSREAAWALFEQHGELTVLEERATEVTSRAHPATARVIAFRPSSAVSPAKRPS
jgi:thiopurine S-methyltransferase